MRKESAKRLRKAQRKKTKCSIGPRSFTPNYNGWSWDKKGRSDGGDFGKKEAVS
ncbi:hypothetical protein C2W64_01772 [Brevibacillus laterosporus]|nr:hypothetical protein C2W64_01772 [Brevibacillus laterosporus]